MLGRARLRRWADGGADGSLLVGAVGTLALNVTTLVLNFALTLVLTRTLGATSYGAYAFAFAWAALLSAVSSLNLTPLVVREVAAHRLKDRWGLLRGVLRWTNGVVATASFVVIAVAAGIAWVTAEGEAIRNPFLLALLLVPATALTALRQAAMQGLGHVVLGRVPETLVAPLLFLGLAAAASETLGRRFTASWAVGAQVAAAAVAFGLGAALLARSLPRDLRRTPAEARRREWASAALPLLAMGIVTAANAQIGTIVLGALGRTADAGVYAVAVRVATFVGFVMLAATYPLMPALSRLSAAADTARLRATIGRSTRSITLLTLVLAVGVTLFARPLLELFGDEFGTGATGVRVLVAGELVRATVGVLAIALLMAGHERRLLVALALGAALNAVLATSLGPLWGVEGAATGQAAGSLASSVVVAIFARKRVGVALASLVKPRA